MMDESVVSQASPSSLRYMLYDSPVGPLHLYANAHHLKGLFFTENLFEAKQRFRVCAVANDDHPILSQTIQQLGQYFQGQRQTFDIPLQMDGTYFQKQAWTALQEIPYGTTWSYAEQAQHLKVPSAVRAVATCNARNPIAIIVPCHRVIRTSGAMGGYAGGLTLKRYLLKLEERVVQSREQLTMDLKQTAPQAGAPTALSN